MYVEYNILRVEEKYKFEYFISIIKLVISAGLVCGAKRPIHYITDESKSNAGW